MKTILYFAIKLNPCLCGSSWTLHAAVCGKSVKDESTTDRFRIREAVCSCTLFGTVCSSFIQPTEITPCVFQHKVIFSKDGKKAARLHSAALKHAEGRVSVSQEKLERQGGPCRLTGTERGAQRRLRADRKLRR